MRSKAVAVVILTLVLAGTAVSQVGGPGAAFCAGDGAQAQCPCPGTTLFQEDFDEGVLPSGWIARGLWTITDSCGAPCGPSPHAYFGDTATCSYTGSFQQPLNRLISPPVTLPAESKSELTYCWTYEFEPEGDAGVVLVHGEDGTVLQYSYKYWVPTQPHDLSALAGQTVRIEFLASVSVWGVPPTLGWKIDNVLVRSTYNGGLGQGCLNSTLQGGELDATGSASIAVKSLNVFAEYLPPSTPALFLVSDTFQPPTPLWAGLNCLGGVPSLLGTKVSNANGIAWVRPFKDQPALFQPGTTYFFQAWYRDSGALAPCGIERNLTNAYQVLALP